MTGVAMSERSERRLAGDLVALTKPRIISLLLVSLGGYLMAGGANAVNMYLDRDIDDRMARTRLRPIPSGRMFPVAVLAFGVALALAATMALAGFYFYVFIYTRWLKRSTPQNIVIGGAAGAFPPLVGWAAVTGKLDLAAGYLFLIVFYWTPPHFWALALLKARDYGRAGVPMAPLVWGEGETKRQMLWYTLVLIPLTLLPVALGTFGTLYLVSALVLDAVFLWSVVRVLRTTNYTAVAWQTYRFSLLYLALLFLAMALDRHIFT